MDMKYNTHVSDEKFVHTFSQKKPEWTDRHIAALVNTLMLHVFKLTIFIFDKFPEDGTIVPKHVGVVT